VTDELCPHGRPLYPQCSRCCLPEMMDYRVMPHDKWVMRIEASAYASDTPLSCFEVFAPLETCQQLFCYDNLHAVPSKDRSERPGVICRLTSGDLLVRPSRADSTGQQYARIRVNGDEISRIRIA
jgi:hypothetical protein